MIPIKGNSLALILGSISFTLVFFINWANNLFHTALLRGIITFMVFYLIGRLLHLLLNLISSPAYKLNNVSNVNLTTIDNLDLKDIYQTQNEATLQTKNNPTEEEVSFQPLEFKKLEVKDIQ